METKIFKKLKNHWAAVLIAVVSGIFTVLPFFYFQVSLGDRYKGVLPQITDDESFYIARIKDVMDGHLTLGNAYLSEHKNQLPQQLFLPELISVQPLKLLKLDIVQGRVFYSFFLPIIAFILTYIIFYLIYPSKLWANLFSTFLFFGLYLFKFTRPVIPQFIFIFWLTQFIILWRLIKNQYNKKLLFLSVLNFGFLFYLYPFYWTFYLVFLVVLTFGFFFGNKLLSKKFFKILIGGLLIGSFYFYFTFLASRLPEYQETLTRLQLVFSRSPSEVKSASLSLAVLFLTGILCWFKRIKINREILFMAAGIVSILIVTNQNIITGQKFEFGHYRMPAVFFLTFTVFYLWHQTKQRFVFLIASLIIFISAAGIYNYTERILKISERDIYNQKYAAVFDWLSENTPKDSVVFANEEISTLIPVYTANNVFYSRYANLFLTSDEEVLNRFILNNFFEEFNRDFVIKNERAIWGVRYVDRYGDAVQANKWRRLLGFKLKDETRLPEEEISKVLVLAGQVQKGSFEERMKDYRFNYFIWDKNKNPSWKSDRVGFKPVYNFENIYVFEL